MSYNGRQEANRLILEKIGHEIEAWPDARFIQILMAMNIIRTEEGSNKMIDDFNMESKGILKNIKQI